MSQFDCCVSNPPTPPPRFLSPLMLLKNEGKSAKKLPLHETFAKSMQFKYCYILFFLIEGSLEALMRYTLINVMSFFHCFISKLQEVKEETL